VNYKIKRLLLSEVDKLDIYHNSDNHRKEQCSLISLHQKYTPSVLICMACMIPIMFCNITDFLKL
jgi:hypothetical protein